MQPQARSGRNDERKGRSLDTDFFLRLLRHLLYEVLVGRQRIGHDTPIISSDLFF